MENNHTLSKSSHVFAMGYEQTVVASTQLQRLALHHGFDKVILKLNCSLYIKQERMCLTTFPKHGV